MLLKLDDNNATLIDPNELQSVYCTSPMVKVIKDTPPRARKWWDFSDPDEYDRKNHFCLILSFKGNPEPQTCHYFADAEKRNKDYLRISTATQVYASLVDTLATDTIRRWKESPTFQSGGVAVAPEGADTPNTINSEIFKREQAEKRAQMAEYAVKNLTAANVDYKRIVAELRAHLAQAIERREN